MLSWSPEVRRPRVSGLRARFLLLLSERFCWLGTGFESMRSHRPTRRRRSRGHRPQFSEFQLSAFPIMKKGNTAVHAEPRSTRRKSNLPPSALSAPPREKKSRRHLSAFSFPNVRFSSVAGGADPGRAAERLTERILSRQTLGNGSRGAAEHAEKIQSFSLRALRASA